MSAGRVYICEDFDDEFGFLSGRFSAHWESDTEPVRFEEGPKGASIEEAIAWGRRRADVVLIQLGDEGLYRSAGVQQPEGDEVGVWPVPGFVARRRRSPKLWYLDRTESDEPILRLARMYFFEPAATELRGGEREQRALVNAIVATPGCEVVRSWFDSEVEPPQVLPGSGGSNWIGVIVRVAARTHAEAEALVGAIAERAKGEADALPVDPGQAGWGLSYAVVPEQPEPSF